MDPRPHVLLGPTAGGKTAVSLPLAEILDAEILCVDSRQIFRGMTVGSAAPTKSERARVRHHLVEEVDPTQGMSAGEFGRRARAVLGDLAARGRRALLVGGSGLYLRAALGGLSDFLPRDPRVRDRLRERLRSHGSEVLHAELARRDPARAERVSPRDGQRVTRALEILEISGRLPSSLRAEGRSAESRARIAVLERDPADLEARMRARVAAMVEAGLLEEVRALLENGLDEDHPVMKSVGYAETLRYLRGETTREGWIDEVVGNTRRLAKRQRTWFRGLQGAVGFPVAAGEAPEVTAGRIAAAWGEG